MTKLGGVIFVMDGVKHDYPFTEAIKCLEEFCDTVVVVVVRTGDGTLQIVQKNVGANTFVREYGKELWDNLSYAGKGRLSAFTNYGISALEEQGCTHVFSLQADEILHEDCYGVVRGLVAANKDMVYHCWRLNLWGSCYQYLHEPKNGYPCSTVVARLMKLPAFAYGDAESLMRTEIVTSVPVNIKAMPEIRIYHMGFVRDPMIHVGKIKHMQEDVFNMDSDKKLIGMEKFNPWAWHNPSDTKFIEEPLPLLIQKWAALRNY